MANIRIAYKFGNEIKYQNVIIDDTATITYTCQSGHVLHGVAENICVGEDWLSPHPVCESKCFVFCEILSLVYILFFSEKKNPVPDVVSPAVPI